MSLAWQQPERPNGVILEYEVKYYEKVSRVAWEPQPRIINCHLYQEHQEGWSRSLQGDSQRESESDREEQLRAVNS